MQNISLFILFSLLLATSLASEPDLNCQSNENGVCINNDVPSTASQVKIAKGSNSKGEPPKASFDNCQDRYDKCTKFAEQGECDKNPGWMIVSCPVSCNACHLRDPQVRCNRKFLNISTEPIYKPDDMNDMFSTVQQRLGHKYEIEVLSLSPYVVSFNNFVTDAEADAILAAVEGDWERSTDSGKENEFGETGRTLSQGRTSSNAWCRQECMDDPHVQSVMRKMEEVTWIPSSHYESLQILQYEPGQFYNVHNDMGPRQVRLSCGPRILTFFLYLSDVEEGGETSFPNLNLKVKPRRGKAILWPSVLNNNLLVQDARTNHAALPVVSGVKYAANSWIHLYDFQKSNLWGCTGAFDYI